MKNKLLLAVCTAVSALAADGAENLLKNPGFEGTWSEPGSYEALPEYWQVDGGFFGRYRIPDHGHNIPDHPEGGRFPASGDYAWELAHINGPAGECSAFQHLPLGSGEYRFSGKVRTAGNDGSDLRLFVFVGDEKRYLDDIPDNAPGYVGFEVEFRVADRGVRPVGIGISRAREGYTPYAHWDDLSFTPLRLTPERDSFAAADSDYDGWIDRLELAIGTDPLNPDSNSSGLPDALDPAPLLPAPSPAVDFLAGEKRFADFPVPQSYFWVSTLQDYPPEVQQEVLRRFEEWRIYPSIGNGNVPHIREAYRARGILVDGWQCVHEKRSFGEALGSASRFDYDNPALTAAFAADQQRKFTTDFMSLVDENTWCPVHYSRENFIAFLIRKGYRPEDFDAADWASLSLPDITRPRPETRAGRVLLRELQYYAEASSLNHFQEVAFAFKQSNPEVRLNLGIFAPWGLGFGYYANLPVTSLWRIGEAALTEWDFYDWVYTGHNIPWERFDIVEAGNQYLTDLLRIPTQLTFSLEFEEEGRDADFYRLIMMANLLLVDNITGVTFFYYGVPTAIGPATLDNPRWGWVGEGVRAATEVYPAVYRLPERHRILIVSDDPLNLGEGSMFDAEGNEKEGAEFLKGIRYGWYFRSYEAIAKAGYDAGFCIPRMVPGLNLEPYDVIVVDADRIDPYPLDRLKEWAASGGGTLLYHPEAAQQDDLGFRRGDPWSGSVARPLPDSVVELKSLLAEKVIRSSFTPLEIPELLRVNVRGEADGDKVVVLANFSDRPQHFALRLAGSHGTVRPLLGHSQAFLDGDVLSGNIEPRQFEVLELPRYEAR